MKRRGPVLTAGLLASLLGLTTATHTQDTSDRQLRSEVTFRLRTVAVTFVPISATADPTHGALLFGDSDARLHVGQLEAHTLLSMGTIDATPGGDGPFLIALDLWLARVGEAWELQTDRGSIPLTHRTTEASADIFAAAVTPTTGATGQLQLKWGRHEWSAGFDFVEPRRSPGATRNPLDGLTGARTRETNTRPAARLSTLSRQNETAIVLPGAVRVSARFLRDLDPEADTGFGLVESTADGQVVMLTHAPVIRLQNEVPLEFTGLSLATGNLAPGIPGAYGVWLKKAGSGWRLVFNNEPDSWGSQHDPAFDVGDVELTYRGDGEASRPLGVALVPTTANTGTLVLQWGPHEWAADFSTAK